MRHAAPTDQHLARVIFALTLILCTLPSLGSARVIDFDDAAEGEIINERYAGVGVHFTAVGNGVSGDVIADVPCDAQASPPHALSYLEIEECPALNDLFGTIEIRFDQPQNVVSINVVNLGPGAVSYVQAFGGSGFIEEKWGAAGPAWVDVTQTITIAPPVDRPRVRRLVLGTKLFADWAFFDDLEFDVVVPNAQPSWGMIKAAHRDR